MTLARDGVPWKTVWLVIKRTIEDEPRYWYYVSNASTSARLKLFVWLSGVRWAIEQCFEETKGDVGMDHYEVRTYAGWYHHMLACILAHFFVASQTHAGRTGSVSHLASTQALIEDRAATQNLFNGGDDRGRPMDSSKKSSRLSLSSKEKITAG